MLGGHLRRGSVTTTIRVMLVVLVGIALAACGSDSGAQRENVTIGLTYVPNIQFAPFYVADALGYYKQAGLDVTFRHHTLSEDEFGALVAGREDIIFGGGDEMLQARAKSVPIVYVADVFTQYPVALIVPQDSPIRSAADLKGRSVGIPGAYGASYIGLLALLKSAGLTEQDVNVQSIGYTQVPALLGDKVDAVMGYVNNEVVQLQKANFPVRTISVTSVQPLISNGLGALEKELQQRPDVVRAVVAATLKGVAYVEQNPEEAVKLSQKYVPGLDDAQKQADALAVLRATIPLMQTSGKPGYNDPAAWKSMEAFLQAQGQLAKAVDPTTAFSNDYLPK